MQGTTAKHNAADTAAQPQVDASRRGRRGIFGRLRPRLPGRIPIVFKLWTMLSLLMVACTGLLAFFVVQQQSQSLREHVDQLGNTLATQLAQTALEPLLADDRLALEVLTSRMLDNETVFGTAILDKSGLVLSQAGHTPLPRTNGSATAAGSTPAALHRLEWSPRTSSDSRPQERNLVTFVSQIRFEQVTAGHAVISLSRSVLDASLDHAMQRIGLVSALVWLIGLVLTYITSRLVSRPIHQLIGASRALEDGHFHFRFQNRPNDEIGNIMGAINRMAEGMQKKAHVEHTLSRYMSPGVVREVLSNSDRLRLGGTSVDATVLFTDVIGFTSMAENMPPEDVCNLLNEYFELIVRACQKNQGMVDKYIGDCAMLAFGVPDPDPEHCFHAITCALLIQRLIADENTRRQQQGELTIEFRLGLNSGKMLAGNMGAHQRMEYTVVGESVNLASRLCSVGDAGQVVISEAVYQRPEIAERVIARPFHSIRLRGIERPVVTYLVEGLAPGYQVILEKQFQVIRGNPPPRPQSRAAGQ